ncbi:MAG: TGS domain-containing protein [Nanoarchaeota archaeon]|nr:TGS domain-containing protein [Nanoarchaeota archaeon]
MEQKFASLLKKIFEKDDPSFKKIVEFLKNKPEANLRKAYEIIKILKKEKYEKDLLVAGILSEFYKESQKEIKELFGERIYSILSEKEKLSEIILKSQDKKSEGIREAIISSVENLHSIILELTCKIAEVKINKNKKDAKDAMENYAPLAERLGLERIKKEITENSFKITNPKKYSEILNFLKMSEKEREDYVKKIILEIDKILKKEIKNFKIKGREKQIFSIYKKIVERKIPLNKQKDQFGIRIITKDKKDCYKVFGLIGSKYPVVEGTYKDYLKNPKENGYESLHFCIKNESKIVEIQIRTKKMDEFAEEGSAAHWTYKKIKGDPKFEKKTAWLKEIIKLKSKRNPLLEAVKINLFKDKIYCYTPKGKMISLPAKSTALDFAYQIHAEVGNQSMGARVNKKFVPLKTELYNGNTVEIITNKFQRPRRDWLKFVKTKYAKKIIAREIKRIENIPVPKIRKESEKKDEETETAVEIKDFPNHLLNFAKCCNPLPPDELIGILRSYKRALIHKKDCDRIKNSKEKEISAEWKDLFSKPVKIFVATTDRPGILADLMNTISRKGFKIKEANAKLTGNNFAECYFVVFLENIENLKEVIKRTKKVKDVRKIWLE